jgi:hypothetical protein
MAAAPLEHANQARLALRTIVTEHGPEMLSRPGVLSNLLADLLPDAPRIARILVAAAQDHIADELREHTSAGMDAQTASRLAATMFADATMFPPDACAWVVGEFALALGLVSDNAAPPIRFSPSVTAVMAGDPLGPVPAAGTGTGRAATGRAVAGQDKSTEPAATEPPAPVGAAAPGRHPAAEAQAQAPEPVPEPGRGRQRGGDADRQRRVKAPFPAAAGLAPGAGAVGAVGAGAAGAGGAVAAHAPSPTDPAGLSEPEAPAATRAMWTAVVTADRAYFDSVIADGHVDAASIEFPSHYPEQRFELKGTHMRIGRRSVSRKLEPEIDLAGPPTDPGISHLHAVLVAQDDGTWSLLDRGSSNGTLVNGRELESGQPVPLRDGDRVCLGAWTALTFRST